VSAFCSGPVPVMLFSGVVHTETRDRRCVGLAHVRDQRSNGCITSLISNAFSGPVLCFQPNLHPNFFLQGWRGRAADSHLKLTQEVSAASCPRYGCCCCCSSHLNLLTACRAGEDGQLSRESNARFVNGCVLSLICNCPFPALSCTSSL
jgi:hypothetical protein